MQTGGELETNMGKLTRGDPKMSRKKSATARSPSDKSKIKRNQFTLETYSGG